MTRPNNLHQRLGRSPWTTCSSGCFPHGCCRHSWRGPCQRLHHPASTSKGTCFLEVQSGGGAIWWSDRSKIQVEPVFFIRGRGKWEGKAARLLQRSLRGRRTRYVCVGGRVYLSTADTAGMQCLQCQQWVLEFTPSPRQKKKTPQRGGREGSDKHINKITKPLRVFVRFSRLFCVVNFIACTEVQKWARLLDARFFLHPQPTLTRFFFFFFFAKNGKRGAGGREKKMVVSTEFMYPYPSAETYAM